MGDVIVTAFVTVDGVASDPDGRGGTDHGGWAFRFGHGPVADDKFRLGTRMRDGVQLYGRTTWEHFAGLWPQRDGEFAALMNGIPKRVATRSGIDTAAWPNSAVVDGDLLDWVSHERVLRDVIVIGSLSVVRALAEADLVDEYRLVTFPLVLGRGERLFSTPSDLRFVSAEINDPAGVTVLTILRRGGSASGPSD
jgi:dihydrofolate reductase